MILEFIYRAEKKENNEEKMNEVTKLAIEFVKNNYDNIDTVEFGLIKSKEQLLKEIEEDYYTACWILTEVMSWGMKDDKDYIKEYQVENEDELFVIKLNGKYFKINFQTYCLDECEPKYKTVIYF